MCVRVPALYVAMMEQAELILVLRCRDVWPVRMCVSEYDFCWTISQNEIPLLFCPCVYLRWFWWCGCMFIIVCLVADLRRPSGELRHVSTLAVPESGLCPHALSLYHRPGGHVFPGHCPVFPGWQGESWETVSDSDIAWTNSSVFYLLFSHLFLKYLQLAWDVYHSLKKIQTQRLSGQPWQKKKIYFILSST